MRVHDALLTALRFLTRVPVRAAGEASADRNTLGAAVVCFPLVGLALGAVQAGLAYVLGTLLPPALVAVIVLTACVLATGALHLDGLADVFDGLGGARGDAARALAIMRDSRVGAFGVIALVLLLATKLAALAALIGDGGWPAPALVLAPAAARAAVAPLIAGFPSARPDGLGKAFAEATTSRHATLTCALCSIAVLALDRACLPALAAAFGAATGLGFWLSRRLGGLTGDAYGAAIELAEAAFLIGAVAAA